MALNANENGTKCNKNMFFFILLILDKNFRTEFFFKMSKNQNSVQNVVSYTLFSGREHSYQI